MLFSNCFTSQQSHIQIRVQQQGLSHETSNSDFQDTSLIHLVPSPARSQRREIWDGIFPFCSGLREQKVWSHGTRLLNEDLLRELLPLPLFRFGTLLKDIGRLSQDGSISNLPRYTALSPQTCHFQAVWSAALSAPEQDRNGHNGLYRYWLTAGIFLSDVFGCFWIVRAQLFLCFARRSCNVSLDSQVHKALQQRCTRSKTGID